MRRTWPARYTNKDLSPRMKMAIRLYESGAVPTKGKAADAVGMNRGTFYIATAPGSKHRQTDRVKQMSMNIQQTIDDKAVSTSAIIELLSREALGAMANLMRDANEEGVRFRATQDLLDRGKETSKIQKHQVESFTLSGRDAKSIAEALVQSAAAREQYAHLADSDFVGVSNEGDQEARLRLEGIIAPEADA